MLEGPLSVILRRASPADAEDVSRLAAASTANAVAPDAETLSPSESRIGLYCLLHPEMIWVAVRSGVLVGFVSTRFTRRNRVGRILDLCISPELVDAGIDRRLARSAIDALVNMKTQRLTAFAAAGSRTERLLLQMGFSVVRNTVHGTLLQARR